MSLSVPPRSIRFAVVPIGDEQDEELRTALTRLVKQLLQDQPEPKRGKDLMPVLDAHLGVVADELPVVVEPISAHRRPSSWEWEVAISGTTAPWAT
jgi:hypothetical protein